jgi:hypothetical protein
VEDVDEDLLPSFGDHPAVSAATDRMYVTLYVHRTEIKIRRRHGKVEREPDIRELPIQAITSRRERLVLITGSSGFRQINISAETRTHPVGKASVSIDRGSRQDPYSDSFEGGRNRDLRPGHR